MLEDLRQHATPMNPTLANTLCKLALATAVFLLAACGRSAPDRLTYQVISTRPHDPDAYTQGFQLIQGRLFESTGHYGQSSVREVDPATGKILRKRPLSKQVFGEGLTLHDDEIWVLTWKENTAYVFDRESFKLLRSFPYPGEGWGLTSNGSQLIMSNGSSELKFIHPKDFQTVKSITVKDGNQPIDQLNELEWVDGEIFANIYMTDRIARISPEDGTVTGWLDLSGLRNLLPKPNRAEVLNGIAHDRDSGHLLVTGKYWPQMFEIKISKK
jgi:glutamine cyclotransferase